MKNHQSTSFLFLILSYFTLCTAFCYKFSPAKGYYGLLASAFLDKKLSLNIEPNPKLLELDNPYDGKQNHGLTLYDASLYKNKYYLYWGPVPAITRIIFLNKVPEQFFIYIYVLGCSISSFYILKKIKTKFFKKVSSIYVYFSLLFVSFNGITINLLASKGIYYEAIAAAQFFLLTGLLFHVNFLMDKKNKNMFIANLFYALSMGSRISYLPAIFFLTTYLLYFYFKQNKFNKNTLSKLIALLSPIIISLGFLGLYNYFRFDSFFEFGLKYQLTGTGVKTELGLKYLLTKTGTKTILAKNNPIHYIPNNIKNYFLALPSITNKTPFLFTNRLFYTNVERFVTSIFIISPITVFNFFGLKKKNSLLNYVCQSFTLSFFLISLFLCLFNIGSATRYMFDMVYLSTIAGSIKLYTLLNTNTNRLQLMFIKSNLIIFIFILLLVTGPLWVRAISEYNWGQYNLINSLF